MWKFYNAENIIGAEEYKVEEENLERVLEFLQMQGLIESDTDELQKYW